MRTPLLPQTLIPNFSKDNKTCLCTASLKSLFSLVIVFILFIVPAGATPSAFDALHLNPLGTVTAVTDAETLVLDDGSHVRLQAINSPDATMTKIFLEKNYVGKKIDVWAGDYLKDRHGRYQGIVAVRSGDILQEKLLQEGLARLYIYAGMDTLGKAEKYLQELKRHESTAIIAKKGIWADPKYQIKNPDQLSDLIGTYQIARGKITSAKKVNNRAFLNFGTDWKTDFTVSLEGKALSAYAKKLKTLEGKTITARGFLANINGPNITATTPLQIDVE